MKCNLPYGPMKPGQEYELLEIGLDFYKVKVKGRPLYAPQLVFGYYEELQEDEEDVD